MNPTDVSDLERDFVLQIAEDLESYVVMDGSLVPYFQNNSSADLSAYFSRHPRIVLSSEFERLIGTEKQLILASHKLKRGSTRANVKTDYPYITDPVIIDDFHKRALAQNRALRREIHHRRLVQTLPEFIKNEGIECPTIHLIKYSSGRLDSRDSFEMARSIASKHSLTLLTVDPNVANRYMDLGKERKLEGRGRFEVALLEPSERAFAYLYPELVSSERFSEFRPIEAVA